MEQENRLEQVKQFLILLVDKLNQADSVAIVTYGYQSQILLEPTGGATKNSSTQRSSACALEARPTPKQVCGLAPSLLTGPTVWERPTG